MIKKQTIGMLVFAALTLSVMAEDPVYTLNIFGTRRVAVDSNSLNLTAQSFTPDGGNIQDTIGPQMTPGASYGEADHVLLWDAEAQTYRRFWLLSYPSDPEWDLKWIDENNQIATNDILLGSAFWVENMQGSNQSFRVKGNVVTAGAVTNVLYEGLQLAGYPYGARIALNASGLTNGLAGASYGESDRILAWDPASRQFQRFWLLDWPSDPAWHRKWIDENNQIATQDLAAGMGFWYQRVSPTPFEWVEAKPYTY